MNSLVEQVPAQKLGRPRNSLRSWGQEVGKPNLRSDNAERGKGVSDALYRLTKRPFTLRREKGGAPR